MSLLSLPCQRLTLAILAPEQAELESDFYARNQRHLAPWSLIRTTEYFSSEQIRRRLEIQASAYEAGLAMHFALLTPDGQQMIGACNFSGIIRGAFQACYLGYHIDHVHQGQGLMQEGLEAGIGYMFDTQNLHRIMANYMPGNERSARLLERLGFEREGYAKAYLNIAGRWQDHVLTALVNPLFETPEKRWSRQLA
ncbi:[SSU ribosomal protein S5P]-alanine acetyltransferase [Pseudomonas sp. LAMO17WK12:I6]|uniref:ribosomal protein S5-alanine N-acetyltransferase n=1 Tax=unclassified Pseudomonas TaxID=196821 RepID=UPI000BD5CED2|nr:MULTISPECIES: ribosomal protein S5-alanine N-acetyltransferase [unclassified Pseudomonas]SNY47096.1 [SSU ribosomal protein S5P]-alanine acetyltransferase [Pseudomonas sp. LAMO17WK12:I5]SNY47939.1 [SSU ribosomal protein S5P]-alanine acetyltransferase [Pseudomonas sp. LAMO17WK12:I6]